VGSRTSTGAGDDPRYFQIRSLQTATLQPGKWQDEHRPLVDERGNVIGIVSAKVLAHGYHASARWHERSVAGECELRGEEVGRRCRAAGRAAARPADRQASPIIFNLPRENAKNTEDFPHPAFGHLLPSDGRRNFLRGLCVLLWLIRITKRGRFTHPRLCFSVPVLSVPVCHGAYLPAAVAGAGAVLRVRPLRRSLLRT
jgi:hypothetical protein